MKKYHLMPIFFSAMLEMKSIRALPAMENSLDNAIDRRVLKVMTDDLRNDDEHHKYFLDWSATAEKAQAKMDETL